MGDRAYDFSKVPGPGAPSIIANGGEGVLTYSFRGQTPDYLDTIRGAGLASVWIWERNTDSIFNGYDYAVSECKLHEANAKPGELTYVACDTNDGGVAGRQLAPFLQGWSDTTREACFGVYGSSGAIRQAQAFGGKCSRYWGVVNWINGGGPDNAPQNIDYWRAAGAHLVQLIGSPISGTDENLILKPEWASIEGADMPLDDQDVTKVTEKIFNPSEFGISPFEAGLTAYFKAHPEAVGGEAIDVAAVLHSASNQELINEFSRRLAG